MRSYIFILVLLTIIPFGCDKINETQRHQVKSSLDCYRLINSKLRDSTYHKHVESLRYQYFKKQRLPFYIPDVKYTMIPRNHIFEMIGMTALDKCRHRLDSLGDFAGIRVVNYNFISYEICRLKRNYGMYGGAHTPIETHRLIYNTSTTRFEKSDFLRPGERISHVETLGEGWTYIVSTF